MSRSIAFLGTGSDVGKSVITAGVGHILHRLGYSVAPFKAQNMSNNSFVTQSGGEMGRAQVVQARACDVEPTVDMNPVLLKPSSDTGSQVIIHGTVFDSVEARDYYEMSAYCREKAFESLRKLQDEYDLLVIEGAGSCSEMNLKRRDFVNFAAAVEADAAVILVADIERGGVFAQVVGTIELLEPHERALVKGIIINKFRGDVTLFDSGVTFLEERYGIPIIGVVPWMADMPLEEEDAVALYSQIDPIKPKEGVYKIGVVVAPHVSNYTDFAPLESVDGVGLTYLSTPNKCSEFDLLIIAGTKSVISDLQFLKSKGWESTLSQFNGKILGVCGGYQMLGKEITDHFGIDGKPGYESGFGLLSGITTFAGSKQVKNSSGESALWGTEVAGYEIHNGVTVHEGEPFCWFGTTPDGEVSSDQRIAGTYLHGLFEESSTVRALLNWVDPSRVSRVTIVPDSFSDAITKVADHLSQALDIETLLNIIGEK